MVKRNIQQQVYSDLESKLVIISGPRQTGKTTLSKSLGYKFEYLNFDNAEDRKNLLKKHWDRNADLLIFDEVHKMSKWKSWLKGVYDKEGVRPRILVTGSAKLNTYKKMGDSLAGRQFNFRLYPLDLKELYLNDPGITPETELRRLMSVGGFPEPFLKNSRTFYNRWKKNHVDLILKQDLPYFESVREISQIETLLILLRERVGSSISYKGLSEELHCDPKSVKKWLDILENLYVVFKVTPYSKNIARSILKEPKYYFYDTAQVEGGDSAQFENVVALSLLKEIHFLEDVFGETGQLFYLKNKERKEIDFLVHLKGKPAKLIEVKTNDDTPSKNFDLFSKYFPKCEKIQLVLNLDKNFSTASGVKVVNAARWLVGTDLS